MLTSFINGRHNVGLRSARQVAAEGGDVRHALGNAEATVHRARLVPVPQVASHGSARRYDMTLPETASGPGQGSCRRGGLAKRAFMAAVATDGAGWHCGLVGYLPIDRGRGRQQNEEGNCRCPHLAGKHPVMPSEGESGRSV